MKRILAFILALCLVFSLVPATVFAEDQSQGQAQVDTGDLTVEGTNGFGTLLSQDIMESQEETTEAEEDYKAGYSIIDLTFEGSTATVAYSSLEKAILVVAVYSEDGLKMLASGTVPVSPDETQTTVAIEGNMPEYFLASAYLMDTFDLSPLCASYDTPMYTREMQELLASTVEDYDEDRVLNLDDSLTTNFAVYSQDTKIIDYVEGVNLVSSVDEENKIYVIENADEQFTELDTGDVFAYAYGTDELLIVKVGEISVDDTTVTITGESVELDEVFDNLKIQGENDARDAEVDDSEADKGITYDGMTAEETAPVVYGSAARDGGTSNKFSLNFKAECFDHKDTTKVKVQVSGTISYSITVSLEYYITRNHKRIECRFPNELSFEGTLSFKAGNKGISLNIGSIKLMIAPGVTMAFKPEIIFEFTGEITGRFGISEMLGFAFETSKDGSDWDALHDNATFFYEAEFVGKLFIGLKLTPAIEILGGALAEISIEGKLGVEFELTKKVEPASDSVIHNCYGCADGDINIILQVEPEIKLFNSKKLKYSVMILDKTWKVGDFYTCLEHKKFAFGDCPNLHYKTTINVRDQNGSPVQNADVRANSMVETTNSNGIAILYLPIGEHTIEASGAGIYVSRTVYVDEARNVDLKAGSSYSGPSGVTGSVDTESIQGKSGKCGDRLTWTVYTSGAEGVLRISGTGAMYDYGSASTVPWNSYRDEISKLSISADITHIGSYAFSNLDKIKFVDFPATLASIGSKAFSGCTSLERLLFYGEAPKIAADAFTGVEATATYFAEMESWTKDKRKSYGGNLMWSALYEPPVELDSGTCGDNLTWSVNDGGGLFIEGSGNMYDYTPDTVPWKEYAHLIIAVNFGDGVTSIGDHIFSGCTILERLTFAGDPPVIDANEFAGLSVIADYPGANPNWAEDLLQNYGGNVIWRPTYQILDSGKCGTEIVWIFDNSGTLRLDGEGDMFSYDTSALPWNKYNNFIYSVIISEDITGICKSAFAGCTSIRDVWFMGDAPNIGQNAFQNVTATVNYPGGNLTWNSEVRQNYGGNLTWSVYLQQICDGVCGADLTWNLDNGGTLSIHGTGAMFDYTYDTVPWADYRHLISSVSIDPGVTRIGDFAFSGCPMLMDIWFDADAPAFGTDVFYGVIADAHYPDLNNTWTEEVCQNYGGEITWDEFVITLDAGVCGLDLVWTLESDCTLSIHGEGAMYDFSTDDVPWAPLASIIKEIVFGDKVSHIGENTFYGCTNLTAITFTGDAPVFGGSEFEGLTATVYYPPENPTWTEDLLQNYGGNITWDHYVYILDTGMCSISVDWILMSNGLMLINGRGDLPDFTPKTVPWREYRDDIAWVLVGDEITRVGSYAFADCTSLKAIAFTGDAPTFGEMVFSGVTASATYPTGNSTWTEDVCQNYGGNITWQMNDPFAEVAGGNCGDNLTWSISGAGILTIDGTGDMDNYIDGFQPWAEYRDRIQEIIIGDGVTGIGDYAFSGCTAVTSVLFYGEVPVFGTNVFAGVCSKAYYYQFNTTWTTDMLKNYGGQLDWSGIITELASGSCGDDLSWSVTTNHSLEITGTGPMYDYTDTTVPWAAYKNEIREISVYNGVSRIGDYAFSGCTNVTRINFYGDAPVFGQNVFQGITAQANIPGNKTGWTDDLLQNYGGNITWKTVFIDAASGTCGDNVKWDLDNWGGLTISGSGAMYDYTADSVPWAKQKNFIRVIYVQEGITAIGDYAFSGLKNLESVYFYGDAPEFGEKVFDGVTTRVLCPIGNETWTDEVLQDCGGEISWGSFMWIVDSGDCGADITWQLDGAGQLSLSGSGATDDYTETSVPWQEYADRIRRITVTEGITSIGAYVFSGLANASDLALPDSLTSIGDYAFANCTALTLVTIPKQITSLGNGVFSGCSSLEIICFTGDAPGFTDQTFAGLTATVIYPRDNASWTSVITTNYGGTITWMEHKPAGEAGENVFWSIEDGVMTVSGSGPMFMYESEADIPWNEYRAEIQKVVIEDGVTSICPFAFSECDNLKTVIMADSVTVIGFFSFAYCDMLSEVVFSENLTLIDEMAFVSCVSLTSVDLPDSLQTIGFAAFSGAALTEVTIPASTTQVGFVAFTGPTFAKIEVAPGNTAFKVVDSVLFSADGKTLVLYPCNLENTSYTIPDGVTTIMDYAMANAFGLTSLTVPASVTAVNYGAFGMCMNLKEVYFTGHAPVFGEDLFIYIDGVTVHYPANDETWTADIMQNYGGTVNWIPIEYPSVNLAAEILEIASGKQDTTEHTVRSSDGKDIVYVSGPGETTAPTIDAVYGGEFDGEILEESIIVRTATFSGLVPGEQYVLLVLNTCETDDFLAPENLLYIDQAVAPEDGTIKFRYIQREDPEVFYAMACGASNKNLKDATITFPDMVADGSVQTVSPVVVYDGTTLVVDKDYILVGETTFTEAGAYTCAIRGICNYAGFVECTYTVTADATVIAEGTCSEQVAWALTDDGTLTISGIGDIPDYSDMSTIPWLDYRQDVLCIVIQNGITCIGENTFYGCENAKRVSVADTVTSIHDYAFMSTGLESITIPASVTSVGYNVFLFCSNLAEIRVDASNEVYSSDAYGVLLNKEQTAIVDVPWGLAGTYEVPGTVTSIDSYAFENCEKLTGVIISENVTYIGTYVFANCSTLTDVLVDPNNTAYSSENNNTIYNKDKTELLAVLPAVEGEFVIPDTVTRIASNAFGGCDKLTGIAIPDGVTHIGSGAFYGCSALNSICLPDGVTCIWDSTFAYCPSLSSVTLSDDLVLISSAAFVYTTSLKELTIPAGVTEISSGAFRYSGLKKIYFIGDAPSIGDDCFDDVSAVAYYPGDNKTWTSDVMQNYGGTINWVPYGEVEEEPIVITTQPVDYVGMVGDTATFSVTAEGEGLKYQWYYFDKEANAWKKSSGTEATLTVEFKGYRNNQQYRCMITDAEGNSVTTEIATLKAQEMNLVITVQPENYVGSVNEDVIFVVDATGNGLVYQWYYSDDGGVSWKKSGSPGFDTPILTPILRAYRDGYQFYCQISDVFGNVVNSDAVSMVVRSSDVVITSQPEDVEMAILSKLYYYNVEATGDNLTYRWEVSTDGGETWELSWNDGYDTANLKVRMNANRDGNLYRCVVTSGLKTAVTTEPAILDMQDPSVELISQSGSVAAVAGKPVSFSVEATGNDLTYAWYRSNDDGTTWILTYLSGYDTDTLSFAAHVNRAAQFKCKITDGSGKSVWSNSVKLQVLSAELKILTQPESVICATGETATFTVEAQGDNLRYAWYASSDGGESWARTWLDGCETATLSFSVTAARASKMYKCVITDVAGNTVETHAVSVTIR